MIELSDVALVAIGRNEGDRLRRCLGSTIGRVAKVVYVDSGSTDGSAGVAAAMGARVVELDLAIPFTAARARNEGAACALVSGNVPAVRYLQFVDGDCEVVSGWLASARAFLETHPAAVAVCGRRRERYPEHSIYNRLCDAEWNTPTGLAKAFGGDVMVRVEAFQAVGGYRADFIAGEDPELAIRLRQSGGEVWRLDAEMTLHDAAMTRFGQWWRRSVRAGYAYALGAATHGAPPERHWVRESMRAWLWGLVIPATSIAALASGHVMAAATIATLYPIQWARLASRYEEPLSFRVAAASLMVLGKFAEVAGQLTFAWHLLTGRQGRLIEYK